MLSSQPEVRHRPQPVRGQRTGAQGRDLKLSFAGPRDRHHPACSADRKLHYNPGPPTFGADVISDLGHRTVNDARQEVKTRLRSLWDTDLNVGAEQLARAILIVSAGDLDQFGCVFDTHFYGDPRDLIMAAMGKSGGQAKYGVEPF